MKKFTDIEYYEIVLYIMAFVLLLISFSILLNSLGLNIYDQNQIDSNKDQISVILAFSTIFLVFITINYAKSTKELLDEQVKKRQVDSIEKVLENIYSPILIALNQFMLNCESLPENRIPDVYNNAFKDLNDVIMNIASKYYHLMNQEIINYYNIELWKAWLQYSSKPDIDNYKNLNSRIKMFGDYITKQLNLEKKSLNKFQQLGEKMNVDERQISCEKIRNTFSKALKEIDLDFLNNFRDKSDLRFIQKLAEIEISKGDSDIGTQFTLILAGVSIFIFTTINKITLLKNYYEFYWIVFSIILLIIGWYWKSIRQKWPKKDKRIKFLYDIILQVERRLP